MKCGVPCYLVGGGHYIRGGSQVLSDRLAGIVRGAGGDLRASREAETILLDGAILGGGWAARAAMTTRARREMLAMERV